MGDRITLEQYNSHDRDLDTLAEVKADCIYKRNVGVCNVSDCRRCSTAVDLTGCFSQLAVCDRMRVDMLARKIAQTHLYYRQQYRRRKMQSNKLLIVSVFVVLLFLVMGTVLVSAQTEFDDYPDELIMSQLQAPEPNPNVHPDKYNEFRNLFMKPYYNDGIIIYTIDWTQGMIRDVTGDGVVTNKDWACMFKYMWDVLFPPSLCQIVVNTGIKPGYEYYLIRCRNNPNNEWVYLEPSAGRYDYEVHDYWGTRYGVTFNRYGETKRIMNSCIGLLPIRK